ncbi:NRAMP (natural resistance-associated macrophage protein)-like metal ion transporter [Luteibacter sp. OK325]|uniref:Nramp family divalent metal transporter n=1 Tax=Luteibacter sp. OK325 TaxID=2135670 RepID=UPI000D3C1A07|nr:Nramp family divalent metal transporter [Luteibacter sp. OK325]PTR34441.1 NRAMP (natural resistance-associated macrophage protein)-like metal ion transporter [Luteibacter sp. OK325]
MTKPDSASSDPWWKRLGGGLVTGAADDDPSGVATYSQVGAQFGYATLWALVLALPLMIGIQTVSARIGRVTGRGLADNMVRNFPKGLVWGITVLLIIANVINIGADLGAMGAAVNLLIGGPTLLYACVLAIVSTVLQVYVPFNRYSPILKFLALSLLTYVATVFVIKVPWGEAMKGTFIPAFQGTAAYATAVVAILGTTISPYLFSWQAAQEVEEIRDSDEREPLKHADEQAPDAFKRIAIDTSVGMVVSNVVAFFIILTAAVVLHAHGKTDIQSSSEAAEALKPVAGKFAFALFSMGIVGTGMLAVPVLAGATAFSVAGTMQAVYGLEHKPADAKLFYGVLVASMLVGALLNLTPIDPVKALYWSAVVNGVCAVPMMVAIMIIANRPKTMGNHGVGRGLRVLGWVATLVMLAAAVVMFATMGKGG